MKFIYSGLESAGKSLRLAKRIKQIVIRNSKWNRITGKSRVIWSNLRLSDSSFSWASSLGVEVKYWSQLEQLPRFYDCDVIIDEVGNYFDSRRWADLSLDVKKWLTQGAKGGVEIYGTAQDFAQVDKAFRRLTTNLEHISKLIGSSRPTPTRPPVPFIWGICMVQTLNPRAYKEDTQKFDSDGLPSFFLIEKEFCMMYDTRQAIEVSELPPYRHEIRRCEHFDSKDPSHSCDFKKVLHS